ncbi:hypothetical protein G7Y89_g8085 [Cudoniella acicularis]|uniref:Uncharacterized protein n=1 Tax=Cudoniella acicularis TaxID=354080 RepID=A0A8H4RJB0_9HELO|nr:hypothetical protein G7Y89_g8085 [Cudoniella acicularis]
MTARYLTLVFVVLSSIQNVLADLDAFSDTNIGPDGFSEQTSSLPLKNITSPSSPPAATGTTLYRFKFNYTSTLPDGSIITPPALLPDWIPRILPTISTVGLHILIIPALPPPMTLKLGKADHSVLLLLLYWITTDYSRTIMENRDFNQLVVSDTSDVALVDEQESGHLGLHNN